jgi:hypothetical protein
MIILQRGELSRHPASARLFQEIPLVLYEHDAYQKGVNAVSPDEDLDFGSRILFMSAPTDGSQNWRVFDEKPFSDAK